MAWKTATFRLVSDSPLLMKNGQTADPLNKFAKASKQITGKKKKTDADYQQLHKIDFLGALYLNQNGPCLPGQLVEATIIGGAKKERNGPTAKAGIFCEGTFDLQYQGPRDQEELFQSDQFRDVRPVKVNGSKSMRCRPIFRDWSAEVLVNYDDNLVNEQDLERWVDAAGMQCGVGDYRPKYGRFRAERV